MGGRRNQIHAYDPDEIDRLKGVPLPAKIRCGRCLKNLPQAKFSVKQLTDARWQVKNNPNGKISKAPNCQPCTGQRIVEIECCMCNKIKGLEAFAKSQRNKPDTAKCFECVEAQLAMEPVNEDRYEDLDKAFVTPDHSGGRYPEYFSSATSTTGSSSTFGDNDWDSVNGNRPNQRNNENSGGIALSKSFQAMSVSGYTDEALTELEYAHPPGRPDNGDGWSEVRTKSWHTQSNAAPSASSGFNPNAYRRSTSSANGSSHTFASSVAERSDTSEIRPNGWAKIRAAPRNPPPTLPRGPPMTPMDDNARERESVVNAWDSDEDDDDEEEEDDDSDDDTVI